MSNGVELKVTPGRGEGIFATKAFKVGEVVLEGVIEKRLEENHSHASQIGENEYVFHAGLISKVNHSCDPVCGIRVNASGAHDFVAFKDIEAGGEITFDYAMRNYGVGYFPKQCLCGAKQCRGQITGWKDLSIERKRAYQGFVAPYLLALDERELVSSVA